MTPEEIKELSELRLQSEQRLQARIANLLAALDEIANSTWVAQTCPEAAQIARMAREDDQKMTEK